MKDFWRDRPVFITGSTGFLGRWLTERLVKLGAEVTCLIRDLVQVPAYFDSTRVAWGDVCDQALLERVIGERQCHTVFHLAAQTQVGIANRNPVSTWDTNVRGAWSVLEACRRSPVVEQIVVASSDKAYGEQEGTTAEDAPLLGLHPYDASKACADRLAQSYASTWGLPVAITRCGNLFGPGDRNWNRLIPGTIRRVLKGERPVIRGDGNATRHYLYIEDAVEGFLMLVQVMAPYSREPLAPWPHGKAFNFAMPLAETTAHVSQMVTKMCGVDLKPVFEPTKHELHHQSLDCSLAYRQIGWKPKHTLAEGLEKTVAWYRENL